MKNILTKWLSALLIAALLLTPMAMMEEAPAGEPVAAETETQTEDVPEVVPEEAPEETDDVPEAAVIPEAVDAVVTEACDIALDVVAEDEEPVEVSDEAEEGNAPTFEAEIVEESLDDLAEFEAAEEAPAPEPEGEAVAEETAEASAKAMAEAAGEIPIDAAHFPDPEFRDYIISNADNDRNGYLSELERNTVYSIFLSFRTPKPGVNYDERICDIGLFDIQIRNSVQSLQGIEYFPNITELCCEGNNLTGTLDLSHNTNLKSISLSKNNLTSLILGNQPKLTRLYCTHNQLTSLDISGCPSLECVDCWDNSIGNFYTNRVLTGFRCGYFNFVNYVCKWTKNKKKAKYCDYATKKLDKSGAPLGRMMCDKSLRIIADKFTPDPSVEQISVAGKRAKATVNAGTTFQINPGATAGKKFKSSKKKVATVSSNGIVTAKAKGKTKITFKVGKKKRTLTLTVNDPTIPQSVTLSAPTTAVKKGDTVTLTPAVPEGTDAGGYKWKSSNKKVATVKNGVVTFRKKGKVTITCTTVRGKKKAKIRFKVGK